ncbi:MAG: hypothetical protein ACKVT2_12385 [Saprospiraceae bacterium]
MKYTVITSKHHDRFAS